MVSVPFAEKGDLDVYRQGNELYVRVGPYRRFSHCGGREDDVEIGAEHRIKCCARLRR